MADYKYLTPEDVIDNLETTEREYFNLQMKLKRIKTELLAWIEATTYANGEVFVDIEPLKKQVEELFG